MWHRIKEILFFVFCAGIVGALWAGAMWLAPAMPAQKVGSPTVMSPKKQAILQSAVAQPSLQAYSQIDLNTATKEQLCLLSGIGEEKAECIIEYRAMYGGFNTIEDLTMILGITEAMIDAWGDQAYLSKIQE